MGHWENITYHHITFERLCVGRGIDCFLIIKHHNFCQTADRDAVIRNLRAGAAGRPKMGPITTLRHCSDILISSEPDKRSRRTYIEYRLKTWFLFHLQGICGGLQLLLVQSYARFREKQVWSNVNRGAEVCFTTLQFASAFSCLVFFDCRSWNRGIIAFVLSTLKWP